jgi:ABC-type uncharacterized transport system permease subunit
VIELLLTLVLGYSLLIILFAIPYWTFKAIRSLFVVASHFRTAPKRTRRRPFLGPP